MPFPMKIQPIDINTPAESTRFELVKPVAKSRLKRLFERQFSSVLKISAPEKSPGNGATTGDEPHHNKDVVDEFDPSSVCLDKMVQNFIEESNDRQQKCGRNRCNCFNGNGTDSSDDEFGESNHYSSFDACEILKSLVPCASVSERNLLADTAKIVEKNKISKRKDDFCRKIVTDGLLALGYDASLCKSRWEKSRSFPSGEYDYVDVMIDGERLIIDIDFRSEFEIARSTKGYKSILQVLPIIFVGKADRLQRIISIVSEASKQSLKKKGMPFPPWRKAEYVKAKWLSNPTRPTPVPKPTAALALPSPNSAAIVISHRTDVKIEESLEGKKKCPAVVEIANDLTDDMFNKMSNDDEEKSLPVSAVKNWELPETKPKSSQVGVKVSSGLASMIED